MDTNKRTVRLLDEAMADAETAIDWYRDHADDEIASRLAQEVDAALEQIANWPFSGRAYDATTRCLLLRTFPFLVLYRVTSDAIEILAVAHERRAPGFWRGR